MRRQARGIAILALATTVFASVTGPALSQAQDASHAPRSRVTIPARSASGEAPVLADRAAETVPGRYMVILGDEVGPARRRQARAAIESNAQALGATVRHRFDSLVHGFSASLPPAALAAVRKDPNVRYVEAVHWARPAAVQPNAPWHLDRIDQRKFALDRVFQPRNDGRGVTAYVIDTAIRLTHTEFGGRAWMARDFIGGAIGTGCMEHGTHVASHVGGAALGVAKGVSIASVRVFPCGEDPSAGTDDLVAAAGWTHTQARRPAVVNMSINSDGSSPTLTSAVERSAQGPDGLTWAVSAGNDDGQDACGHSPADAPSALTVAAIDEANRRASFSNRGSCVDLFAPGRTVLLADEDNDADFALDSGTSFSAPLVAGVAATYLSANPSAGAPAVRAAILNASTKDVVVDAGAESPNRLLYSDLWPIPGVSANGGLNGMFNGYGDGANCASWSGGDGTQSTLLPSGRRAWFFADSFLDSPSERRDSVFSFSSVRNSIVVQNGSSLRTITGGNTCQEDNTSLPFWDRYADTSVEDSSQASNAFYWPNDGIVVGGNVVRFYYRNVPTPDGWWTDTHTAIATIPASSLDNATALKVHPYLMPPRYSYGQHPINWGSALLEDGGWVYIYGAGVIDAANNRVTYLARATPGDLANPGRWQFNRGGGQDAWSAPGDQAAAQPVHGGLLVGNGFSVTKVDGAYWLVQHEPSLNGGDIVAHPALKPWSFNPGKVRLYTPPEGPRDAAHKHQFCYEARLHRDLSNAGQLVLSYNVNSSEVSIGCRQRILHEADIYRPRFVNIPAAALYVGNADTGPAPALQQAGPEARRGISGHRPNVRPPLKTPAPSAGSWAAALAPDLGWYDQWSSPQKENHGCPPLTRPTTLSATTTPAGLVTLSWSNYGRNMWYWLYSRDATRNQPFTKNELWANSDWITQAPITTAEDNGHVFEYYVVPFAYGDPTPNHLAPASNVVRLTVQIAPPATPQNVRPHHLPVPRELTVLWDQVTYPSSSVYYALWYWDESIGETEAQARKISLIGPQNTSWTIRDLVSGHQYAFRMDASNLAGVSPPSAIGRGTVL